MRDDRPPRPSAKTFTALPYDVLHSVFDLLPSRDLVHLLCCCRCLHSLIGQESIWRNLSARYGLRDITYFGGRSWYIVYTRLLHTYGPMLGLWVGDHAYTGSMLEARLHQGDSTIQGGIIVSNLHFRVLQPEELDEPEEPELPAYTPLIRIDFTQTSTLYGDARALCSSRRPPHSPILDYFSSTTQAFFLSTRQGEFLHPDFPGTELLPWIDQSSYPRLPNLRHAETVDQRTTHSGQRPRIPIIFSSPATLRKPPALSLSCPHGCVNRVRPLLGFDNSAPLLPRYYPLRRSPYPTVDPASASWQPTSLVGLWLGSHGPHGTEALFLDWDHRAGALRAWKITGDENVPRGALSWEVSARVARTPAQVPACVHNLGDLSRFRLFSGTGTVSARGFLPHQRTNVPVILAVGEVDRLQMVWTDPDMGDISGYIRYKERERVVAPSDHADSAPAISRNERG